MGSPARDSSGFFVHSLLLEMSQIVLTGNRYLKGQSYPTIDSEIVIEIKKGATWDEEFFVPGDFSNWDINFHVAKKFDVFVPELDSNGDPVLDGNGDPVLVEDRMATGRVTGVMFGDFTLPVLDEENNPVLDEDGVPVIRNLENYTYFKVILDSTVTALMDVSPIAFKDIEFPRSGKDYWQADLEASRDNGGILEVEPLYLDLTPVVVRGQV